MIRAAYRNGFLSLKLFFYMNFSDFVLAGTTTDLAKEQKARSIADAIEFRMDLADDPFNSIKRYTGELPLIASLGTEDGKTVDISRNDSFLTALGSDAVKAVDIELDKVRHDEDTIEQINQYDVDRIISYYNFNQTPSQEKLLEIAKEGISIGDIAKISVMAQSPKDTITLLSAINECDQKGIPISGVSLGPIGSHTRIMAPLYGSRIGYAPIDLSEDIPYAGQFELKELQQLIENARYEDNDIELHELLADKPEFQNK